MALGGQRPRGPMLAGSFLVRQSQQLDWLAGLFILWPFQAIPQAPSSLIFVLLFPLPQFLFLEGKTKLIFGSGWHRVTSDSFTRFRSEFFFFFFSFPCCGAAGRGYIWTCLRPCWPTGVPTLLSEYLIALHHDTVGMPKILQSTEYSIREIEDSALRRRSSISTRDLVVRFEITALPLILKEILLPSLPSYSKNSGTF